MFKLVLLMTIQCVILTVSQVFFKIGANKISDFSLRLNLVKEILLNSYFWIAGFIILIQGLIWMYVLRKYDFSLAYPIASLTFVFGLLVAAYIFHETVPINRWIGVGVIVLGIILVTQK